MGGWDFKTFWRNLVRSKGLIAMVRFNGKYVLVRFNFGLVYLSIMIVISLERVL